MIPVQKQPEPDDFAHKVSEPGEAWLKKQRFYDASAPEKRSEVPDGTTSHLCGANAQSSYMTATGEYVPILPFVCIEGLEQKV